MITVTFQLSNRWIPIGSSNWGPRASHTNPPASNCALRVIIKLIKPRGVLFVFQRRFFARAKRYTRKIAPKNFRSNQGVTRLDYPSGGGFTGAADDGDSLFIIGLIVDFPKWKIHPVGSLKNDTRSPRLLINQIYRVTVDPIKIWYVIVLFEESNTLRHRTPNAQRTNRSIQTD